MKDVLLVVMKVDQKAEMKVVKSEIRLVDGSVEMMVDLLVGMMVDLSAV